jgi:hypothetical protein
MLKIAARVYLGEESSTNPLASPLLGDLRGLPLHASTSELPRGDSVRLAARALEADCPRSTFRITKINKNCSRPTSLTQVRIW